MGPCPVADTSDERPHTRALFHAHRAEQGRSRVPGRSRDPLDRLALHRLDRGGRGCIASRQPAPVDRPAGTTGPLVGRSDSGRVRRSDGFAARPVFHRGIALWEPVLRGAYPEYTFPNEAKKPPKSPDDRVFQAPSLTLSSGLTLDRLNHRTELLCELDRQRGVLEATATALRFDRHRQSAISLLASTEVRHAFDVTRADHKTQERYGRNSFGWSLLMAFRLVEAGVSLIQVNLGNNETWDTHGDIFPRMKDKLLPPTDRALCALLDDLDSHGLLETTLLVMGSEFGRTPRLSALAESYALPGRDHWGAVQSVWFAGGGVRGGTVIGSSDKIGAYPAANPQTPENMAATIYKALGIPSTAAWRDELDRPHQIYQGSPISGLI